MDVLGTFGATGELAKVGQDLALPGYAEIFLVGDVVRFSSLPGAHRGRDAWIIPTKRMTTPHW
jgi:hypothetical protein